MTEKDARIATLEKESAMYKDLFFKSEERRKFHIDRNAALEVALHKLDTCIHLHGCAQRKWGARAGLARATDLEGL